MKSDFSFPNLFLEVVCGTFSLLQKEPDVPQRPHHLQTAEHSVAPYPPPQK